MIANMEGGKVKIWFQGTSTSRNIDNVDTIEIVEDMALVRTGEGNSYYINMRNVNLIEEVAK